jgi:hypothetical protein
MGEESVENLRHLSAGQAIALCRQVTQALRENPSRALYRRGVALSVCLPDPTDAEGELALYDLWDAVRWVPDEIKSACDFRPETDQASFGNPLDACGLNPKHEATSTSEDAY